MYWALNTLLLLDEAILYRESDFWYWLACTDRATIRHCLLWVEPDKNLTVPLKNWCARSIWKVDENIHIHIFRRCRQTLLFIMNRKLFTMNTYTNSFLKKSRFCVDRPLQTLYILFQVNDDKQWIQVDLKAINLVTKIMTFGDREDSYVKTYKIQFSGDESSWIDYMQHGTVRVSWTNFEIQNSIPFLLA